VALPQIDIARIVRTLLRHLWIIALVAGVCGSGLYIQAKKKSSEVYHTETQLAFTMLVYVDQVLNKGKPNETIVQEAVRSYYTLATPGKYTVMLQSDAVIDLLIIFLQERYNKDYSQLGDAIRRSSYISATAEPGIFNLGVTNDDPTFCNEVLNALITVYPDYLKRFESTLGIEIIRRPKTAWKISSNDDSKSQRNFGILVGGGGMAVLFVLLEMSKKTIRSAQEVRSRTSERFLGMVPFQVAGRRRFQRKKDDHVLHILDKRNVSFDFVENVKAIRAKVENVAAEWEGKVFAVTSTFENEGKTTLAVNLALALAQKGKSVLLMDCDLRKPAVARSLGLEANEAAGLLPAIAGKASYEDSVQYIKHLRLFVLATGGVTDNPTECFGSQRMEQLMTKARSEFDYVIIDTPPARVVADCIVLAPYLDGLIYSIRYDYARAHQINETLDEIAVAGIKVVGSVLAMAASERLVGRNGYSAVYRRPGKYVGGYGYGYGYGTGSGRYGKNGYGYGGRQTDDSDET
ncbi:MAG: polysaccharide biosynthesis tyrosine autokinase, partial [Oscillospiraceae bacterium]|jgi:receptor protein-tyrosine kinase|nr:polysaccharide biosynthesis tyrosine autokinase [Oscillospiraceae bacterium]